MLVRAVAEYESVRQADLRDESRTNDPLLRRLRNGSFVRLSGYRSNQLRPELLFAYTPVPGTVFFAGYGGTLDDQRAYRFRRLERQQDQLFFKVSYLLRAQRRNRGLVTEYVVFTRTILVTRAGYWLLELVTGCDTPGSLLSR